MSDRALTHLIHDLDDLSSNLYIEAHITNKLS